MFNVWLPAVLESRAEGEGDEVIKMALREFMLYAGQLYLFSVQALADVSVAGCPGSIVNHITARLRWIKLIV